MEFDDWLLALHVLAAFALVGAMTIFTIVFVALRSTDLPGRVTALMPAVRGGQIAVAVGAIGTIVFGIWLAISLDAYQVWDGWVIAAIILWAIGTEAGRRSGEALRPAFERAGQLAGEGKTESDAELRTQLASPNAALLHGISVLAVILVLVDMIWKPGA